MQKRSTTAIQELCSLPSNSFTEPKTPAEPKNAISKGPQVLSNQLAQMDVNGSSRVVRQRQTQEAARIQDKSLCLAASTRRDVPERIRTRADVAAWIIWCQAQFLAGILERGDFFLALGGFAAMDRFLPRDGTPLDVPLEIPQYLNEVINGKVVKQRRITMRPKEM
jgi:hypothetical protein